MRGTRGARGQGGKGGEGARGEGAKGMRRARGVRGARGVRCPGEGVVSTCCEELKGSISGSKQKPDGCEEKGEGWIWL